MSETVLVTPTHGYPEIIQQKAMPSSPIPPLDSLQRPEKLSKALKDDMRDDCLSCRLVGKPIILLVLSEACSNSRVDCAIHTRCNSTYWTWRLHLLLGQISAPAARSLDLKKWQQVWNAV